MINEKFDDCITDMDLYISLLDQLNTISNDYTDTEYDIISIITEFLCNFVRFDELEVLGNEIIPKFKELSDKLLADRFRE